MTEHDKPNFIGLQMHAQTRKVHYVCLAIKLVNVADKCLISRSLFLQNECLLLYMHPNNLVELFEQFLW